MIVTIDGGVASGKSAVGRRVAEKLGLPFIDSGLMYRAITRLAMQRGIDPRDDAEVTGLAESTKLRIEGERVWADGQELTDEIYYTDYADALPIISAIPGVRKPLVVQGVALAPMTGVVLGPESVPVAHARVEIPSADLVTETNWRGLFRFEGVPMEPAKKLVRVRARGRELDLTVDRPADGSMVVIHFDRLLED